MSWMHGPPDPPPPHPNLDVTTRGFYGSDNALPCEFWPGCYHGEDAVVQVYELFGDASRRFFRCPHFKIDDCYFTCWIDGPMVLHVQEYIWHLQVLIDWSQQEDMEKHQFVNQLLEHSRQKDG